MHSIYFFHLFRERIKKLIKAKSIYGHIYQKVKQNAAIEQKKLAAGIGGATSDSGPSSNTTSVDTAGAGALMPYEAANTTSHPGSTVAEIHSNSQQQNTTSQLQLIPKKAPSIPKPKWHAPWKLYRVISGHLGWVRCVAVEPGNEWFVTGAADRVIKVWDLASGKLKLSLTGHVSTVRGVAVSPRHPYLFSCGEDRQVKCWDLEYNKVS